MKKMALLVFALLQIQISAQITTLQSGSWNNPAVWSWGSVPDSLTDVLISAGHIISVTDTLAVCRNIAFGDTAAHLDMDANSLLSVYGDFVIFSNDHNVFSAGWSATNAAVRFAGGAYQQIKNFRHLGGSSCFRDLIVDKWDGIVATDTTVNTTIAVQNSFIIRRGQFTLSLNDDIEGRFAQSINFGAFPDIIVEKEGTFFMAGGTSHIRSSSSNGYIGKMTVYGTVSFATTSTNRININNIDIEEGGRVSFTTGWSTASPRFNPDTVTVKPGGMIRNSTTTNFWVDTCVVYLMTGGSYETTASVTFFPQNFINKGTVRYSRNSSASDQTVTDMDYHRLEFSFASSGTKKNWTLSADRTISDSLEINNSAELVLTGAALYKATVNKTLRLTSGMLNNSSSSAQLALADSVVISRATGQITNPPLFGNSVDLRYTSSVASVTTGPEVPDADIIQDVSVFSTGQTVTAGKSFRIKGNLTLSAGTFDNNGEADDMTVTFAPGAGIRRATGQLSVPPAVEGALNLEYISTVEQITTGLETAVTPNSIAQITLSGDKGVRLGSDLYANGAVNTSGSSLYTDAFKLVLNPGAVLSEGEYQVFGNVYAERNVSAGSQENFGNAGFSLNASNAPGQMTLLRTNLPDSGGFGINRKFDITADNNSGLNATVVFTYADNDLRNFNEANLALFKSTDAGVNWLNQGGTIDPAANTITLSGVQSFSKWGASDKDNPTSTEENGMPALFDLLTNYPNPFNPETTLLFSVKESGSASVLLYDISGAEVAVLFSGELKAGESRQIKISGTGLSSGTYFAVLQTTGKRLIHKLSYIK